MADKTGIEWTESTWNPVTGCSKVSQGCKHCYAERDWARLAHLPAYKGRAFTDVACHPERLDQPLRWMRPRLIFVNSMSDLFHPDVPDSFIDQVFAVMALAKQHTFQVLTKRPERMRDYLRCGGSCITVGIRQAIERMGYQDIGAVDKALPNVWLGVSVEDQASADERIPLLLDTPAAVRWVSMEPLLGPVDLTSVRPTIFAATANTLTGWWTWDGGPTRREAHTIDWVVVGGESGPKARPMHPSWARSLRDQCAAADVPFLFKQWGEWREPLEGEDYDTTMGRAQRVPAFIVAPSGTVHCFENEQTSDGGCAMLRVGKKLAGRLLDGVQHDGYPEVS